MDYSNTKGHAFDPQPHFERVVKSYDTVDKVQQSVTFALQEIDRKISECHSEMLVLYQNLAHCQALRLRMTDALSKWDSFFSSFSPTFDPDTRVPPDPDETTPIVRKSLVYKYLQKTPIVEQSEESSIVEDSAEDSMAWSNEPSRMEFDPAILPPAFRSGSGAAKVEQIYNSLSDDPKNIDELLQRLPAIGKEMLELILALLARKQFIKEEDKEGRKIWSK